MEPEIHLLTSYYNKILTNTDEVNTQITYHMPIACIENIYVNKLII